MPLLTNVKNSWVGTTETTEAIPPYRIPMGQGEWIIYTDLRRSSGYTEANGYRITDSPSAATTFVIGDHIVIPFDKEIIGAFPFEYSVANSAATDTASTIAASVDNSTGTIVLSSARNNGVVTKNRIGLIVVVR